MCICFQLIKLETISFSSECYWDLKKKKMNTGVKIMCIPLVHNMRYWGEKNAWLKMIIFVVDCAVINICFHHQQLLNGKTLNPVNVQQYFKAGTHKCLIHKHFTIFSSKNMKPNNSNINSQVSIKITFVTKGCWGGERFFFSLEAIKWVSGGDISPKC